MDISYFKKISLENRIASIKHGSKRSSWSNNETSYGYHAPVYLKKMCTPGLTIQAAILRPQPFLLHPRQSHPLWEQRRLPEQRRPPPRLVVGFASWKIWLSNFIPSKGWTIKHVYNVKTKISIWIRSWNMASRIGKSSFSQSLVEACWSS